MKGGRLRPMRVMTRKTLSPCVVERIGQFFTTSEMEVDKRCHVAGLIQEQKLTLAP